MRRITIAPVLLLLAGLPVAAVVRAQESESDRPSWSQRWGSLKKSITGGDEEAGEPAEVRSEDWSAGRKFGSVVKQPGLQAAAPANQSRPVFETARATRPVATPRAEVTPAPIEAPVPPALPAIQASSPAPAAPAPAITVPQPAAAEPAMTSSRRTARPAAAPATPAMTGRSATTAPPRAAATKVTDTDTESTESTPVDPGPFAETPSTSSARGQTLQERIAASRQATEPSTEEAPAVTPPAPAAGPFRDRPQAPPSQREIPAETSPSDAASETSAVPAASPRVARSEPIGGAKGTGAVNKPLLDDNVLFARKSPQLGVETSGPRSIVVGKEATYTVVIQNSGEVAAQDVVVSVKVPAWADVVNARMTAGSTKPISQTQADEPFQWTIPRVEAKSRNELSLQLIPRESKPFDLAVQWTFQPIASQALVEVQEPKLAMSLSGPEEVLYGETKSYNISLSNPGTGPAENVIIELMPLGDGQGGARQPVGTIAAGESKVITVELTARQTGNVTIRAKATADNGLLTEASEEVLVRRAAIEVAVEAPTFTYSGNMVDYQIRVSNPGNATADGVEVVATLPAGVKLISCSSGGQPNGDQTTVTWNVGDMRSSGDVILEMKCVLNTAGDNRLEVNAKAKGDLKDVATAATNVEAVADLKLEVTDPRGPVPVGDDMTYEIKIVNRGSRSAEGIEVLAFFSEGIEPVGVQGGQHEIMPGQVIFRPITTLAAESEVIYKIKARASTSGNHVFRAEVNCENLGTKLASEESTHFFGDAIGSSTEGSAQPLQVPAPIQPIEMDGPLTPVYDAE